MRVLVVGLNVSLHRDGERRLARTGQWEMLRLFTSQLRHPVHAAVAEFSNADGQYDLDVSDEQSVVFLNERPFRRLGRLLESPRVHFRLAQAMHNADYVYIRLPSFVGAAATRIAHLQRKDYFVSVHGDWRDIFALAQGVGPVRRLYNTVMASRVQRMTEEAVNGARHAFFVGQNLAQSFRLEPQRVTVFANYLHDSGDVRSTKPWPAPGNPVRLLFVGELSRAKGVHVLLEAFRRLTMLPQFDLRLCFVGVGPEASRLRSEAAGELTGRLSVLGWKRPGPELDAAFSESDLVVLPSLSEGVPKVLIEAMVRSLPVVASDVGAIPVLLGGGARGELVRPNDVESLTSGIRSVLEDATTRNARLEEARRYVRRHDRTSTMRTIRSALSSVDPQLLIPEDLVESNSRPI